MSIKTLLAGDESEFLEQIEEFTDKTGKDIQFYTALSADKALKMVDEKDIDVIVSDYQMPEIDGLGFLKTLREDGADETLFIILIGKGQEDIAMKALDLGANRYLQKVGEPEEWYGILTGAIEQEYRYHIAEKERSKYTAELEFLNDLMVNISRMDSTDEICEYVAEKVYSLDEDDYVIVSLFDREEEIIRIRAVAGFEDYPQLVEDFMDPDEELRFDPEILDEWPDIYSSGKLELMPEGIYSLVKGVLSKEEAEEIEDLLGVEKVYSVGLALDNKPYGSLTVLKTSGERIKFSSAVETIASHLSVTLQRRQYKENLRKNKEKFKELFNAGPDPTYLLDRDGVFQEVNQATTELLGYEKEKIIGKEISEVPFLPSKAKEKILEKSKKRVKGEEVGPYTIEAEGKDGEQLFAEMNSALIEEKGEPVGSIGIARDITEKKKAEEKAKKGQKRLIRSQKLAKVGSWELDPKTDELDWSDETYSIFGVSNAEDMDYEKFLGFVHPDDRDYVEKKRKEGLKTGKFDIEHRIKVDGKTKWVREKADIEFDDEGEPIEIIGSVQDITDLKETKKSLDDMEERKESLVEGMKRYRNLVEASPDAILLVEIDSEKIIDANMRAENLFKMDREDIIGKNLSLLRPEREAEEYRNIFNRWETDSIETKKRELHIVDAEGEEVPVEIGASSLEVGDQTVAYGVFRDITGRKEAEEREKFLHSLLRHDVRNKTSVIKGYLEIAMKNDDPKKIDQYLSAALEGVKENIEIIEKVRFLREAQEEDISEVRINKVMNKAVEQTKDMAIDKGIEIELGYMEDDLQVQGGALLEQLLTNIIENSIQHSEGNKIKIHGTTTGEEAICIIEDDGKGIPDEKKEKIFEKGFTTDEERGTGLGMFLVQTLVQVYGGEVKVKDSDLGGARFDVKLKKINP